MATKVKKSKDEEEEDLLREENERQTTEARCKITQIREKSKERSEDDKRRRALESIHRMEWLKNKDDASVLQRGTKAKPRGRRKDRVEVIKNLEDLGLPPCKPPPSSRHPPPAPPPPQNAWAVKPGSALFPNTTAATMVTLQLKDYDEDAMLKKALEESLSYSEEGLFCISEEYEEESPWAPSSSDSPSVARSALGQERSRNENPWVHGQGHSDHKQRNDIGHLIHGQGNDIGHSGHGLRNDIGHSDHGQGNDFGQSVQGQKNDVIRSGHGQKNDLGHADHKPRNNIIPKPEINNQNNRRSPTLKQSIELPDEEIKEKDSNTTKKKASGGSSVGKPDEEEPIDYYKKGKELAEKRARERALMFAAQEAEKKKNEKVAQEMQENVSSKTELKSSPSRHVRFSPEIMSDDNNKELREVTPLLPDTRASVVQLSPESENLTKTHKVPEEPVEPQPPQVQGEQRHFWSSKETQMKQPFIEVHQPGSTTVTPPREVSATNKTSTQRLYTPEDFIVMDNAETLEIPVMDQLSLYHGAGLNQYKPYVAYPYGVGSSSDGVLPEYIGNPAAQTPNSFPGVTYRNFVPPSSASLTAQNMYEIAPDGLAASPQFNAGSPTVEVTSTSPQDSNLSPSYVNTNPPGAQNYYAANMSPPNVTTSVAADGSSNASYQVPAPSLATPASTPNSVQEMTPNVPVQDYSNVDRWLQLNILLSQYLMSQLCGAPTPGGDVSLETLAALIPPLPNVPQTSADVAKPAPPPPILEPNIRLPSSFRQAPVNPSQSSSLTTSYFQPVPNAVYGVPPVQAGYAQVQPPQRLPGSFIRGPFGRGRGVVQTLQ